MKAYSLSKGDELGQFCPKGLELFVGNIALLIVDVTVNK